MNGAAIVRRRFKRAPRRSIHRFARLACAAAIVAAGIARYGRSSASADTVTWSDSGGDQLWSDAANWTGGLPSENDVIFGNAGAATVAGTVTSVIDQSITINSLNFNNSPGSYQDVSIQSGVTLNIAGALNVNTGDANALLGSSTESVSANSVNINSGTLDVSGSTTFSITNELTIGGAGTGAFSLGNGAQLHLGTPASPIAVNIGYGGTATLAPNSSTSPNISLNATNFQIGTYGGNGTVDLSHYTGAFNASNVYIGSYVGTGATGTGQLILGGATAYSVGGMSVYSGGLTINAGTTLNVTGGLTVGGFSGTGTATLMPGAGLNLGTSANPVGLDVGYMNGTGTFAPNSAASPNISMNIGFLRVGVYGGNGTVDLSQYTGVFNVSNVYLGSYVGSGATGTGQLILGGATAYSVGGMSIYSGGLTINAGTTLNVTGGLTIGGFSGTGTATLMPGAGLNVGTSGNPVGLDIGYMNGTGAFAPNSAANPNISMNIGVLRVGVYGGNGTVDLSHYTGAFNASNVYIGSYVGTGATGTGQLTLGGATAYSVGGMSVYSGGLTINAGTTLNVTGGLTVGGFSGTGTATLMPGAGLNLGTSANPVGLDVGYMNGTGTFAPNSAASPNISMNIGVLRVGVYGGNGTVDLSHYTGAFNASNVFIGSYVGTGATGTGQLTLGGATAYSVGGMSVYSGGLTINAGTTLNVTGGLTVGGFSGTGTATLMPGAGLNLGTSANPVGLDVGYMNGTGAFAPNSPANPSISMNIGSLRVGVYGGNGNVDLSNYTGTFNVGTIYLGSYSGSGALGTGQVTLGGATNYTLYSVGLYNGTMTVNGGSTLNLTDGGAIGGFGGKGALSLMPGAGLNIGTSVNPTLLNVGGNAGTGTFAPNSASNPNISMNLTDLLVGTYGGNGNVDLSNYTGTFNVGTIYLGSYSGTGALGTGQVTLGDATNYSIYSVGLYNGTMTVNGGSTLKLTGGVVIGGFGGSGTLTLMPDAGLQLLGAAQVGSGTLYAATGSTVSGAGPVTLSGGTLTVNGTWSVNGLTSINSGAAGFNGAVSGPIGVNGGTATFAGGGPAWIGISAGSVTFASPATATAFTSVIVSGGATTVLPGGSLNAASLSIVGGTTTVQGGSTAGSIVAGSGPGSTALTMSAQTLTLNADAVGPGRLVLNGDVAFTNTSGTATIATSTVAAGQLPGTVDFDGGVHRLTVASGGTALISAAVTDGGFVKSGTGTLVLSNPSNTFSGGITVLTGTLQITAPSQISGGITISFSGPHVGTLMVDSDGELGVQSSPLTIAGGTFSPTGSFATSRSVIVGDASGNGNGTITVAAAKTLNLNGPLSGTAGLIAAGPGTLQLNVAPTYPGQTQITGGTLLLGSAGSLANSYEVTVASGATLDLGGHSQTLQVLAGAGTISLGAGSLTVSDPGSHNATLFSGAITGTGGVTRTGPGSLTLTGTSGFTGGLTASGGATIYLAGASGFKGGINAAGGTIDTASDAAMGDSSNNVQLSAGKLAVTASFSTARSINVASAGGTINVSAAAMVIDSGLLSGSGPTTLSGGGTLRLTSAGSLSAPIAITGGRLALSGGGNLLSVPSLTLSAGSTLLLDESTDSGGSLAGGRLNAPTITSGGGAITVLGANAMSTSEMLGSLTLNPGQTILSVTDGTSGTAQLSFAGLTHRIGSQVIFETGDGSTLGGTDRIMLGGFAAGLMPAWARIEVGAGLLPAAYDPTVGVIPYSSYVPPTSSEGEGAVTTAPEPGAGSLCAVASLLAIRRRRRSPRYEV